MTSFQMLQQKTSKDREAAAEQTDPIGLSLGAICALHFALNAAVDQERIFFF